MKEDMIYTRQFEKFSISKSLSDCLVRTNELNLDVKGREYDNLVTNGDIVYPYNKLDILTDFKIRLGDEVYLNNKPLIDKFMDNNLPSEERNKALKVFKLINVLRVARECDPTFRCYMGKEDYWFLSKDPCNFYLKPDYTLIDYYQDLINTAFKMYRSGKLVSSNIKELSLSLESN